MARYIDADALLEDLQQKHCNKCNMYDGLKCKTCELDDTIYYLENAPAADVAPKSEVDRWRLQLEAVLEEIPETKREIAMETFDEIGNAMCKTYNAVQLDAHLWHMYGYMDDHSLAGWEKGSYLQGMKRMIDVVRELKKKYTEETNP